MPQIQKLGNKDKQRRSPQGAAKRRGNAITSAEGTRTKPHSQKRMSAEAAEEAERTNTAGVKKARVAIAVTGKERSHGRKTSMPTSSRRGAKKASGKWHNIQPSAATPDVPKKAAHRLGPKSVGSAAPASTKAKRRRDPELHPRKRKVA
jgi:hypothetical protein